MGAGNHLRVRFFRESDAVKPAEMAKALGNEFFHDLSVFCKSVFLDLISSHNIAKTDVDLPNALTTHHIDANIFFIS